MSTNTVARYLQGSLLAGSLLGAASCSQDAPRTLVTIADARAHPAQLVDTGPTGDSAGDILVFDQPLLDERQQVIGNNAGSCLRTRVAHSS